MRKNFFFAALALLMMMGTLPVMAQSSMTDSQVIQYVQDGLAQGKSQQQLMTELMAKGVTQEQALRLKTMYDNGQISTTGTGSTGYYGLDSTSRSRDNEDKLTEETNKTAEETKQNPGSENKTEEVFGRNIFNNKQLTFEPDINVATPQDYRLGPGDEIIIDIWGASENTIRQEITPDGCINVNGLGVISLNGMNISDAKEYLKSELSRIYADEANQIQVTLGKTRSIKINVVGEVMVPGTYTLYGAGHLYPIGFRIGIPCSLQCGRYH